MDRQRWDIIREIFDAALELPAVERNGYIRGASGGDPDICSDVSLLLEADEEAGDFLESPMASGGPFGTGFAGQPPLQSGEILCDRFRILRMVGEGGMGHVFEAWDLELGRRVALKTIRPEIASEPEALKRFRREVSLALAITHPNVCRTFDIEREARVGNDGKSQAIVFLTMEFLEGETLSARIARSGPLPLNEALTIAMQIADALGSAHELGILHRDIKPANVMLAGLDLKSASARASATLAMRVVITDFGLARQEAVFRGGDHSAISRSGFPAGTLAYMAPEQLEGTATSAATDIYAFGLVLFEMVTGRRAFPSRSPLSGIRNRLAGPPPSPRTLTPGLPETWTRAIEGCLRTNPGDRYQSVTDVVQVLNGGRIALPRITHTTTRPGLRRSWFASAYSYASGLPLRSILVALTIFLIVSLSLSYKLIRFYRAEGNSPVKPGAFVYLTQVKNETGEKTFDNLTELLQAGLTQSAQINLLSQDRVEETLQNMTRPPESAIDAATAREIALRTGAVRVIFATVTGSRGNYRLDVDIQRPDGNTLDRFRSHSQQSFPWQTTGSTNTGTIPPELLSAVRDTTDWVRQRVGESENDIGRLDAPPEDVTTGSWGALIDYALAEQLASRGKRDEAANALYSAIKRDQTFALAYARLGDILVNLGRLDEGCRAYLKALSIGEGQRLSLRERSRIKGIYAQDTGAFSASENAFREYTLYYEHDYLGWFYLSRSLLMLGRISEAKTMLIHAHDADPTKVGAVAILVRLCLLQGDSPAARKWRGQLSLLKADAAAQYADGLISFVDRNYSAASSSFLDVTKSSNSLYRALAFRSLADLSAEQGEYEKAIKYLNEYSSDTPGDASRLLDRAYLECKVRRFTQALNDIQSAINKDKSLDNLISASAILGKFIPSAPPLEAKPLRSQLDSLATLIPKDYFGVISSVAKSRIRGEVFLANGSAKEALAEFKKADTLEAPFQSREYLGRAMEVISEQSGSPNAAHQFREKALNAYESTALHVANVWQFPTAYPPGFYSDQLESWLRLSTALGHKGNSGPTSLAILQRLRATSHDTAAIEPPSTVATFR
jgi:serine/threonine protein kinase/tetratricopeptide (TPR) repeat protein